MPYFYHFFVSVEDRGKKRNGKNKDSKLVINKNLYLCTPVPIPEGQEQDAEITEV